MGMPAARAGDMHMCPMMTPGVPPIPHVGGPILPPGCPTVLISGMPAARVGRYGDVRRAAGPDRDGVGDGAHRQYAGGTDGRLHRARGDDCAGVPHRFDRLNGGA